MRGVGKLNWFESVLYGIVSGITEFLPISSLAHQKLMLKLFGQATHDPLQDLFVNLALLVAAFMGCKNLIDQLRRGRHLRNNQRRGIRGNNDLLEIRFLKNASFPMLIAYFILLKCVPIGNSLIFVAVFSLLNAVIIFFPSRLMQGNKNERAVSIVDSFLVGLAGALSVFPGISRIASMLAVASIRGIEKRKAIDWALLLSIPALLLQVVVNLFALFTVEGRGNVYSSFWTYILSAIGAFAFGYVGISIMQSSTGKDHSNYSFYAFGIMLFALFLYLSVV